MFVFEMILVTMGSSHNGINVYETDLKIMQNYTTVCRMSLGNFMSILKLTMINLQVTLINLPVILINIQYRGYR